MAKKKFSDLPATTSIGASDLLATSQVDADAQSGYTSKKITGGNLARSINVGIEYPTDLETEDKTIIGAINEINSKALAIDSASGDVASFDTAISAPLVSLSTTIVAKGGGGTPSTPIPIVGYSEVNLKRCGKNLLNAELNEAGGINASGEEIVDANNRRSSVYYPIGEGVTITMSSNLSLNRLYFYDENKNFISPRAEGQPSVTATAPSGARFFRWSAYKVGIAESDILNGNMQIELGSTATAYEPYNGQTIILALGQTVYGGRLYYKNGWKCDVTHGIVDLSTLNWSLTSLTPEIQAYATGDLATLAKLPANNSTPLNAICSTRSVVSVNAIYSNNNAIAMNNGGTTFSRVDGASTPPTGTLAYELATPFTIDLSSSDMLDAVVGKNNVFSDCGVTSLTFIDKMQHYVDKKIAELQALILQ